MRHPAQRRRRGAAAAALAALVALPLAAHAQAAPTAAPVREEILGYDPTTGTLASIELTPSGVPGFSHVALVETTANGARRTRLTTDVDAQRVRGATNAMAVRGEIDARVAHDVAAQRARYAAQGTVLPVSAPPGGGCTRAPFAPRQQPVADDLVARVTVEPDGTGSHIALAQGGRVGAATDVPSVTLSQNSTVVHAPYDRVVDARALPGTDTYALLLRSDACTPDRASVPAHAVLVAPPPPPEHALEPLPHAELAEADVIHALAPHARRRTVDEVSGWFDGRARVVFDNAWQLPDGHVLVQYTRQEADLPPAESDAGRAYARFATIEGGEGHGRIHVLAQLAPPTAQNVFEGNGQEAFGADLDGDGLPEVVVRARYQPDAEETTVIRIEEGAPTFVWRAQSRADERTLGTAAQPEVRRCDEGVDGRDLVVRCTVERYRAGAPAGSAPIARERQVRRLRWNGGAVQVVESQR